MSYDPRRRRYRHDPSARSQATRALKLAHRTGVSLKRAWQMVKSGARTSRRAYRIARTGRGRLDPRTIKLISSGPRGGVYFAGPHRRRYEPMTRRTYRRRHDPVRMPGGRGVLGKLLNGVVFSAAAVGGKFVGDKINTAVPQANVPITANKGINLASFLGGAVVSGFGPKGGLMGAVVQGAAGGVAAGSDPVSSQLGGGSMRYLGAAQYGSLGV